jgi:pimeloyl-ACP methyl ester carboxylesterase
MRISITRRVTAAVATAGLLLVGVPALAPSASAADACALGATCEGAVTGALGSSAYKIKMPTKFNGTVLLYNHGTRIGTPIPARLAVPLGFAASSSYVATSVPAFAPIFGSDVAYVGSNAAETGPSPSVEQALLDQGYALAGVGFARQGFASAEGVDADEAMIRQINSGAVAGTKKIMVWGSSLGALIAQTVAERNPRKVAGVLPLCGPLAGPEQAMETAMTVLFTWKTLIDPTLRVANYQSYPQALGDLGKVLGTLDGVAKGTASVSAVGYPIAQANLLAGLMAGLPTVSTVYDGVTVNPAFATLGTGPALAGGFQPASAGASSAAAMLQNIGAAAALGVLVRYDLEQRARLLAQIPATESANFTDNVNVSYTALLSDEQRGEFGDTLNASTVMPNLLNAMLAKLDESKGNPALRFPANPAATAAVRALPYPKGVYTVPTTMITTTNDPVVPDANQSSFATKLMASAKAKGVQAMVGQYYTVPPADGWTTFAPGAKGPDAVASASKATSGVGHCNFAVGGGVQMLNAVSALNRMVNNPTPKGLKRANQLMWGTVGVNGDGAYQPAPLKRPQLAGK